MRTVVRTVNSVINNDNNNHADQVTPQLIEKFVKLFKTHRCDFDGALEATEDDGIAGG